MEIAQTIVVFFSGLLLFLSAMVAVSKSMSKLAQPKLREILEDFARSKLKGVLLGVAATAIMQSSSITTVIAVSLVNAGIMPLNLAICVILGANVGTTITAWIISLADLANLGFVFFLLNPKNLAPYLMVAGVLYYMFGKGKKRKTKSFIIIGFAMLFFGIDVMETALKPLASSEAFRTMFETFQNPISGIAAGALVTAAVQSSSASIGILQSLAAVGLVTFSAAVPIIMGQNIGTCITVMISVIGANKTAKSAARAHLYFNVAGTLLFTIVLYGFGAINLFAFKDDFVTRTQISIFHSCFNIINVLWMLPFTDVLTRLASGEKRVVSLSRD